MEEEKYKHDDDKSKLCFSCIEESNSAWLMYSRGSSKRKQFQTFCNINTCTSYVKIIPQLRHRCIIASINNWLILRDNLQLDTFSIFNPFTLQTVALPRTPLPAGSVYRKEYIKCGLRSTPDCHDCVVFLSFKKQSSTLIFYCYPNQTDCCWVSHTFQTRKPELDENLNGVDSLVSEILSVNGVNYVFLTDNLPEKLIYRVDMDESESSSLVLRPLEIHGSDSLPRNGGREYLVESCGCVYLVYIAEFQYVRVSELDFDTCSWREINSLDGRAFFVGRECCNTWCWGSDSGSIQRDCIYVITFYGSLYIYNLQDNTWMPLRPFSITISPLYDTPIWVIPHHLRISKMEQEIKKVDTNRIGYNNDLDIELSELPLDMIQKISDHMHVFEYWNFRATCKLYHSLCPAPQWRTNNVLPLFLFFHNGGSGVSKVIDPCRHEILSHVVPFFRNPFMVQFSKNGWVLALVGKSLQYFNFFTGMKGEYPNPSIMDGTYWSDVGDDLYLYFDALGSIAFSTDPTCSDCLTIGTIRSYGDSVHIFYHEAGKETWNHCSFTPENGKSFKPSDCPPLFLGGAFYILDAKGYLGVFRLVNGEGTWRTYAKPQILNECFNTHLVDCEGELYSVFIDTEGQWVQVFRFDNLMKSWVETDDLENRVLFVSRASSCSIVTTDRKMRNRIYLPRLYKKGVVFYSLETKTYHSLTSDDILKDLYGTSRSSCCCWV